MVSKKEKIAANVMLFMCAMFWGSSYAVRKMAVGHAQPLFFNGFRYMIGFFSVFVVYLFMLARKRGKGATDDAEKGAGLRTAQLPLSAEKQAVAPGIQPLLPLGRQIASGLLIGAVFSVGTNLQQFGLLTSDAGKCGFITALYIIIIPLASRLLFKTHISAKIWIGVCVALPGLFFISMGDSFDLVIGDAFFLIGAFFFAAQTMLVGHFVLRSDALLLSSMSLLSNGGLSLVLSLLFERGARVTGFSAMLGPAIYTGLFTVGVAAILQFMGQKKATPSVTAIIISFESVFGALFALILLQEYMSILQIVGCFMIFFAIIISQMESRPAPKQA